MTEADDAAGVIRHGLANKDQAPGVVRVIAREEDARLWESFGVDVTTPGGRLEHARLLDWMRSRFNRRDEIDKVHVFGLRMAAQEAEIWAALQFAAKWRNREREMEDALGWVSRTSERLGDLGKEGRKGAISLLFTVLAAVLSAGVTGIVTAAVMRGGH